MLARTQCFLISRCRRICTVKVYFAKNWHI